MNYFTSEQTVANANQIESKLNTSVESGLQCVNTIPGQKDISSDLRQAFVADHQFETVKRPFPNNL